MGPDPTPKMLVAKFEQLLKGESEAWFRVGPNCIHLGRDDDGFVISNLLETQMVSVSLILCTPP